MVAGGTGYVRNDAGSDFELLNGSSWSTSKTASASGEE
jgi:hypothetical protein